jgi:hypothetical protein
MVRLILLDTFFILNGSIGKRVTMRHLVSGHSVAAQGAHSLWVGYWPVLSPRAYDCWA